MRPGLLGGERHGDLGDDGPGGEAEAEVEIRQCVFQTRPFKCEYRGNYGQFFPAMFSRILEIKNRKGRNLEENESAESRVGKRTKF